MLFLICASFRDFTSEPSSPKFSRLLTSIQGSDLETTSTQIVRPSNLRMLLSKPTKRVRYYCREFDDTLMVPMFGSHMYAILFFSRYQ